MQEYDIVLPKGNPDKIIQMAKKLGYKNLYLVYPFELFHKAKKELEQRKTSLGLEIKTGILVSPKNAYAAAKHSDFLIAKSTLDPNQDRQLFENRRIKMIYDLELNPRRDSFHHRNSGLNQVLCKLAAKNNIAIAFSLATLLNSDRMKQAQILGRMQQNKRFCQKYNVKTAVCSFARDEWGMRGRYELLL